jgi:ankyrin repeat protein
VRVQYFQLKIGEIENVNKTENNTGATGLMFAAMNGNVELIKILIGFGAELDAKDTGKSLSEAFVFASTNPQYEIFH